MVQTVRSDQQGRTGGMVSENRAAEAQLRDPSTSNKWRLSNPMPPPLPSPQLQLYQFASKSYSLKPSPLNTCLGVPFEVLATLCQYLLTQILAFLYGYKVFSLFI